jgi:hypothetical protein
VAKADHELRFLQEATAPDGLQGVVGLQDLDGDRPPGGDIVAGKHHAHTADRQNAIDPVPISQQRTESLEKSEDRHLYLARRPPGRRANP